MLYQPAPEQINYPDHQLDVKQAASLQTVLRAFPKVEGEMRPKIRIISHYFSWPDEVGLETFDITNFSTWKIISEELTVEEIAFKENKVQELVSRVSASMITANKLAELGYDVEVVNACGDTDAFGSAMPSEVITTIVNQFQRNYYVENTIPLRHVRYGFSTLEELAAGAYDSYGLAGLISVTSDYHVPRTQMYVNMLPAQIKHQLRNTKIFVLGNPIIEIEPTEHTNGKFSNLAFFTGYGQVDLEDEVIELLKKAAIPQTREAQERTKDKIIKLLGSFYGNLIIDYLSAKGRMKVPLPELIRLVHTRRDPDNRIKEIRSILKETEHIEAEMRSKQES